MEIDLKSIYQIELCGPLGNLRIQTRTAVPLSTAALTTSH
jgi:hypothetical protein